MDNICWERIFAGLGNVGEVKLAVLKIEHCNAFCSVAFSDAVVKYKVFNYKDDALGMAVSVGFDTLFKDGIKFLSDLKNVDGKFDTLKPHEKTAFQLLYDFFKNVVHYEKSLTKVFERDVLSETDITVALAEHLLGKLAPGKEYVIDHRVKDKGKCKCGCDAEPTFGNTGIGHEAVWHGYIDIILSSHLGLPFSDVAVKTVDKCANKEEAANEKEGADKEEAENEEEAADEEEAETSPPRKKRKREGDLEETSISPSIPHGAVEQTLAQTIVFSLLQKQKHPDFKNFLIPNILISPERTQIIMYDAEHDVLLCSNIIDLYDPFSSHLVPGTLVILWMVLHYRMFCTGLPPEAHEYRSHFKKFAEAKWDIYSESLKSDVAFFGPVIEKKFDFYWDLRNALKIPIFSSTGRPEALI